MKKELKFSDDDKKMFETESKRHRKCSSETCFERQVPYSNFTEKPDLVSSCDWAIKCKYFNHLEWDDFLEMYWSFYPEREEKDEMYELIKKELKFRGEDPNVIDMVLKIHSERRLPPIPLEFLMDALNAILNDYYIEIEDSENVSSSPAEIKTCDLNRSGKKIPLIPYEMLVEKLHDYYDEIEIEATKIRIEERRKYILKIPTEDLK